ncbi:MAG: NAD-dependent succinate-semialdehyde dehydrogenase [Acidobacteriota bacterium]
MTDHDTMQSINPATEEVLRTFRTHSSRDIEELLSLAAERYRGWRSTSFAERSALLRRAAAYLQGHKSRFAAIITAEMGKPIVEAEAEVEKCAWGCDYYADNAEKFLAAEPRESSGRECYLQYTPLGTILAVMPWNFPFWQVFRFAAPALMAGNTALLKHASNVPQCSLAIEEVFRESGYPPGCFRSLLISGAAAAAMIEDPRIAAVTLTGSEAAGGSVASRAGSAIKKTVLELGGSDPFIVLEDADIGAAVSTGVRARYQNTGQSCIAAKRFIVVGHAYEEYRDRFAAAVGQLKVGNPDDRSTQIGPLARRDLIDDLERQVEVSVARGARLLAGGRRIPGRGYFFEPTVLADVPPDAPASCEEVFGPVAALMRAADPAEAVRIANSSAYGLGASLWTADLSLARTLARDIETGQVFINGMVASDPRLPFGGIKRSGYGRELSELGIREFTNIQTVWIGPSA